MTNLRVVTSHPAKQVVAYDISRQLAAHGYLAAHLAAVYYVPRRFPYNLASFAPGAARRKVQRELLKRRCNALPDESIVDWPWVELAIRAIQQFPGLRYLPAYRVIDIAHDRFAAHWIRRHRRIDIVMAYAGSALETLRAARAIGVRSVLIAIHPLSHQRIIAAEYERLRVPVPPSHLPRLFRELEVADYFLTPSSMTTDSLVEVGVPRARIKQIPLGIDVPAGQQLPTRPVSDRVRFLFVGKLSIHKGLHVLRQAWSLVDLPNVSLTLVGRPIGRFEAGLVETWTDRRVHVIPEVADIAEAYRQADVFVFPSLVEGFGMVTLEAMASGLPVIVTEHSPAVVRDGVDGFVARPGDPEALARCMTQLAQQPALRAELGRNAYECARQYTWERFGSELCGWLNAIADR